MSEPNDRLYPGRPVVAASIALIRDAKVLIARRARAPLIGLYSFPGGGVELGETLGEAALRELREETGLRGEIVDFLDHIEPIVHDGERVRAHFVIASFIGRWVGGEPRASAELDDFAWVDAEQVLSYRTTEGLPRLVAKALAKT